MFWVWKRKKRKRFELHGLTYHPSYTVWWGMMQRCYSSNAIGYKYYGGRGIKVCDRWQASILAFYEDMGHKPDGCQIDRIDNDGNYEPNNCRWATPTENLRHKRDVVLSMEIADKIRELKEQGLKRKEIAIKLNINPNNLGCVLYNKNWRK